MKTPNRTPGETPERTPDAVPAAGDGGHDAVALLKSDHRSVEALFEKYEAATSASEKAELVANICRELIVHTVLEEELFYPACRAAKVERGELDEAQVEHDSAKVLTAELMMEKPDAAYFDAKVKVLSEYIKLHVGEEENPGEGIFARALAAGVDMHALGEKLQARKSRLLEWMESPEFDPPSPRSLHVMIARKHSQESKAMPRYSKDLERDERGRFVSDDDHRRGSRYRDDHDDRRGFYDDRTRNESGQFTRDDDRRWDNDRDREENGRFISHDEHSGMYSSRPRYGRDDGDDRGSAQYRPRDEGRFTSGDDRGRSSRRHDDEDRNGGRGWYGDPRGHAEAAHRGWEHRDSGRYASRGDDDRRGHSLSRGRRDDDDDRGHGGWYGDPEGHSEASRRGWRNR